MGGRLAGMRDSGAARLHCEKAPFGLACDAPHPQELGVRSWPTWGCEASKFPWSYDSTGE